jgi:hypothetical protein
VSPVGSRYRAGAMKIMTASVAAAMTSCQKDYTVEDPCVGTGLPHG